MLFLIALEMVFEKRTQRREDRAEAVARDAQARQREWEDISVFPMGIPMLAGPGSIASAMLLMSRADHVAERLTVLGALAAVLLLAPVALPRSGGSRVGKECGGSGKVRWGTLTLKKNTE